jgi:lipid II:glycine glycyltransferase (peptidoglycan interpeptide bridge formation enzyme)
MNVEFVNPLLEGHWNEWLLEHEAATFFHTAEWARVLTESYRYPVHYGVLKEAEHAVGLLPLMEVASAFTGRRGVSLPFSDECAPLLRVGMTLDSIVESVRALGRLRGWDYLELRGEAGSLPDAVCSDEYKVHHLVLERSEELQFKKLSDSHRRNIRKARKAAIEIHRLRTRDAMDAYYELHCLTRQRQGLPPQPRRFFHAIHEAVITRGHGFVQLARFNGEWIAGAVYLHFGLKAIYKFGASNPAFQHLRPNNLVMWEAIRYLSEAGLTELSFGRTDPLNRGLLQFKRGWGVKEVTLRYYRIGLRKNVPLRKTDRGYRNGIVSKIMRHLPIALLRLLGILAYRHMG